MPHRWSGRNRSAASGNSFSQITHSAPRHCGTDPPCIRMRMLNALCNWFSLLKDCWEVDAGCRDGVASASPVRVKSFVVSVDRGVSDISHYFRQKQRTIRRAIHHCDSPHDRISAIPTCPLTQSPLERRRSWTGTARRPSRRRSVAVPSGTALPPLHAAGVSRHPRSSGGRLSYLCERAGA